MNVGSLDSSERSSTEASLTTPSLWPCLSPPWLGKQTSASLGDLVSPVASGVFSVGRQSEVLLQIPR